LKRGLIDQSARDEIVSKANNELDEWKKTLNDPS